MSEPVRVMLQMRSTPMLAAASFGPVGTAPAAAFAMGPAQAPTTGPRFPGLQIDTGYSPVPIPPRSSGGPAASGAAFALATASFSGADPATYLLRGAVHPDTLQAFLEKAGTDPGVVGVFADPRIQPIAHVCPNGPIGSDLTVAQLLQVAELQRRGMDGAGVRVVIVDTGFNLTYLRARGKTPAFDADLSWGPLANQPLGNMPVDHGTMCAYDVCICAPACTVVDHAVLTSQTPGGSTMDGLLSDAVQAYGILLSWLTRGPQPFAGDHFPRTLVVNNSWGMFQPSWDFPVGDPQNYSDNPNHPFNILVASLEAAGADILFAAGNCGPECPDGRCGTFTNAGIYGANSSAAVTCVAGVATQNNTRLGYSTKGPGRLEKQKPDLACYTHFAGSGVYTADGGTSAATPVATGVVAAIRRLYPSSLVPPARLRDLLRHSAVQPGGTRGHNYEYGFGVLDVKRLLAALEKDFGDPNAQTAPKPKTKKKNPARS